MIVGRLAPSPTGLLHLGHARTFLIAWWHARARGGKIAMRLEDLDGERCQQEFSDAALRDLEWLGLDWDGPARIQSSGLDRIQQALRDLESAGLTYPCVCTRSDIRTAATAPQLGGGREVRYPGTCRGQYASVAEALTRTGRTAALRLRVEPEVVRFTDALAGNVETDVSLDAGDFVVARRDGIPAYQLAVVVDDAFDNVTEIVRGDDLLTSTARQRLLQRALGLTPIETAHVPLVLDAEGERIAKRKSALSLYELRQSGVDPRAIATWAAQTVGIEATELGAARDFTASFSLDRVPRTPIRLEPDPTASLLRPRA